MTKEFLNDVCTFINEENIFPGCEALVQEVTKPNVSKLAITFKRDGISPVIYEEAFEDAENVHEAVDIITQCMKQADYMHIDSTGLLDTLKSKISEVSMRVVNYDRNIEMTKAYAGRKVMDLFIFYYITLSENDMATVTIKKEMLDTFEVTEEELYNIACKNLESEGVCTSMLEILKQQAGDDEIVDMMLDTMDEPPMYVLTNKLKVHGASQILNFKALNELADKLKSDLVVIPSSIHELIAVPVKDDMDEDDFKSMIGEVNNTYVSPSEYLGDHPYYYSRLKCGYTI